MNMAPVRIQRPAYITATMRSTDHSLGVQSIAIALASLVSMASEYHSLSPDAQG